MLIKHVGVLAAFIMAATVLMPTGSAIASRDGAVNEFMLGRDSTTKFSTSLGGRPPRGPRSAEPARQTGASGGSGVSSIYRVLENGCSVGVHGAEFALDPMAACLSAIGPGGPPAAARVVDAGALAERAVGELRLPKPRMETAPPTRSAVGLPTWLWVDRGRWRPLSESISVSGATLRVFATPSQTVWDMGERTRVCNGPGRPWREGLGSAAGCTYEYQRTSKRRPNGQYSISSRVRYDITWACTGNCSEGGGVLGTLESPTAAKQLPVVELVPVLVK